MGPARSQCWTAGTGRLDFGGSATRYASRRSATCCRAGSPRPRGTPRGLVQLLSLSLHPDFVSATLEKPLPADACPMDLRIALLVNLLDGAAQPNLQVVVALRRVRVGVVNRLHHTHHRAHLQLARLRRGSRCAPVGCCAANGGRTDPQLQFIAPTFLLQRLLPLCRFSKLLAHPFDGLAQELHLCLVAILAAECRVVRLPSSGVPDLLRLLDETLDPRRPWIQRGHARRLAR
mmetsp:Transcript_69147/g.150455  ORF Transcript_69147/g.150455 Transcript_69147/m.150455 type:complete len:233 (-) Transcript_69147:253-951(-)